MDEEHGFTRPAYFVFELGTVQLRALHDTPSTVASFRRRYYSGPSFVLVRRSSVSASWAAGSASAGGGAHEFAPSGFSREVARSTEEVAGSREADDESARQAQHATT